MVISDKPVQITEDGSCDDSVIFSDKAVVVSQDERPGKIFEEKRKIF